MKIQKLLWIAAIVLIALISYQIRVKQGNKESPAKSYAIDYTPAENIGQKQKPHTDYSKYGSYQLLKDSEDPSKGWGPVVYVPRTSPQELFEAKQATAQLRLAKYNQAQKEKEFYAERDRRNMAIDATYHKRKMDIQSQELQERAEANRHQEEMYKAQNPPALYRGSLPQEVIIYSGDDWVRYMMYGY